MVYSPWVCKESDRTNSFTFHLLRVPGFGRGRWVLAPGSKGEIQLSTTFWTCEDSHLVTQPKPLKRPGWWKGKFALFWMPARGGGHPHQTPVQRPTPPSLTIGKKGFID